MSINKNIKCLVFCFMYIALALSENYFQLSFELIANVMFCVAYMCNKECTNFLLL